MGKKLEKAKQIIHLEAGFFGRIIGGAGAGAFFGPVGLVVGLVAGGVLAVNNAVQNDRAKNDREAAQRQQARDRVAQEERTREAVKQASEAAEKAAQTKLAAQKAQAELTQKAASERAKQAEQTQREARERAEQSESAQREARERAEQSERTQREAREHAEQSERTERVARERAEQSERTEREARERAEQAERTEREARERAEEVARKEHAARELAERTEEQHKVQYNTAVERARSSYNANDLIQAYSSFLEAYKHSKYIHFTRPLLKDVFFKGSNEKEELVTTIHKVFTQLFMKNYHNNDYHAVFQIIFDAPKELGVVSKLNLDEKNLINLHVEAVKLLSDDKLKRISDDIILALARIFVPKNEKMDDAIVLNEFRMNPVYKKLIGNDSSSVTLSLS